MIGSLTTASQKDIAYVATATRYGGTGNFSDDFTAKSQCEITLTVSRNMARQGV